MIRISNSLIGILNIISLVVSIIIVWTGLYLRLHGETECQKFFDNPVIIVGGFLFLLSLVGLIGSCGYVTELICLYLFILSFVIAGLICFTIFAFIVTNKGAGRMVSGTGFEEYRLGDYSNWLRNHIVDAKNWEKIKSCLVDAEVCRSLGKDFNEEAAVFYNMTLTATQSGCCKPPTYCGFKYINATLWEMPKTGPAVPDSDCRTWSNQQNELCFECQSCKAGVLDNLQKEWKKIVNINIVILLFLFIVNSIASCAYRNNRYHRYERYTGYYD